MTAAAATAAAAAAEVSLEALEHGVEKAEMKEKSQEQSYRADNTGDISSHCEELGLKHWYKIGIKYSQYIGFCH